MIIELKSVVDNYIKQSIYIEVKNVWIIDGKG